jgi:hypothetical protein
MRHYHSVSFPSANYSLEHLEPRQLLSVTDLGPPHTLTPRLRVSQPQAATARIRHIAGSRARSAQAESPIATPASTTLTPIASATVSAAAAFAPVPVAATIAGRSIFYNNSHWSDPALGFTTDNAIDTSKTALLPMQTAPFANYTGSSKGINGIFIDVNNLPAGSPTAADFTFNVGNDPAAWITASSPSTISVSRGMGTGGSDRIQLIWPDNAIKNIWLQITVKATAATGLVAPDVFCFGNAIGETGNNPNDAAVNSGDIIAVRDHPTSFGNPALASNPYDFNHDASVNSSDIIIARDHPTSFSTTLKFLHPPVGNAQLLPATWYDADIGGPGLAGSGHFNPSSGIWDLSGSGSDIWNAADQFNYAYTTLTGDGVIVARVTSMQNTDPWAKAGIMFRETLNAASRDAYVTMTPHNQIQLLDRTALGIAAVDSGDANNIAFPVWEKLVRQGNTITAFWSANGTTWNALGSPIAVAMAPTIYVGLVASAHNNALVTNAAFDNVSVTATPTTGVYRLTTFGQQGMALDVEGWGNANGTGVSLYTANHTSNQQWRVENQGDGTYKIYAFSGANSLQMLDTANGSTANLNPVKTWEDNGNDAQRWIFLPVGNGYYRIVPKNADGTAQTLEILGGNGAGLGARTDVYGYWGGDNQVFKVDDPGPQLYLNSPKKGLAGWESHIPDIHPSWFYTWGGDRPAGTSPSVEFVPMEWGYYGNAKNGSVNWLNGVKSQPGVTTLLGFNEPDNSTQANLSVASALDGWQYMNQTGLILGSPAAVHADDQWMRDFMAGAAQRNYRVDFVTIHWYGGNDPNGFLGYVDYIHNLYGKPVWITEFAPADWSGNHGISPQQAWDFMRQVIPALNARSYVQRYSWFSAGTGDAALGQSALYNDNGTLTELGKLYARM